MGELAYLALKQRGLDNAEAAKVLSGEAAEEAAERQRRVEERDSRIGQAVADLGKAAIHPKPTNEQ